jgi:hypothetical protein
MFGDLQKLYRRWVLEPEHYIDAEHLTSAFEDIVLTPVEAMDDHAPESFPVGASGTCLSHRKGTSSVWFTTYCFPIHLSFGKYFPLLMVAALGYSLLASNCRQEPASRQPLTLPQTTFPCKSQ